MEGVSDSRQLELEVDLILPTNSSLRLGASMKVLLDGVVASFHCHDGSGEIDLLAGRIAQQLGGRSVADVQRLLLLGPAALGVRPLVRRFGAGVQWNPADDWLVSLDVRARPKGTGRARCSAKLYEVMVGS